MSAQFTLEMAQELLDEMWDWTNEEVEIRDDYSGRSMYGKTCVAFVIDGDTTKVLIAMGFAAGRLSANADEADDKDSLWYGFEARNLPNRTDSMGRGTVIY